MDKRESEGGASPSLGSDYPRQKPLPAMITPDQHDQLWQWKCEDRKLCIHVVLELIMTGLKNH